MHPATPGTHRALVTLAPYSYTYAHTLSNSLLFSLCHVDCGGSGSHFVPIMLALV